LRRKARDLDVLEKLTFDTEAILAFYFGESGAEVVGESLRRVQKGEIEGFMNVLNLTEVHYILCRVNSGLAEQKLRNLRLYNLKIVPIEDDDLWLKAAIIKSGHSLSLADAFAAATAKILESKLVVGSDQEFEGLDIPLLRIRD
jgi:predicted nucleic acid-binding protein